MEPDYRNEKNEKRLKFKGKNYIAVKEEILGGCSNCDLINKGCYTSIRANAICAQGYVFKRVKKSNK